MTRAEAIERLTSEGFTMEAAATVCDVLQIGLEAVLAVPANWPPNYQETFKTLWRSRLGQWKGQETAFRALDKAMKAGSSWGNIIAGVDRYALSKRVRDGYIQHPGTWLNASGWCDEEGSRITTADSPSFFEIGFSPRT